MALTDAEVWQCKYELGFNLLTAGAEPYIGVTALFDQVISPFLTAATETTSSTSVTAATSPTPVTLTLASASGFAAGEVVVVDVDSRQERATIQSLTGSDITVQLTLAHSGTYPVLLEGPESIVRTLLLRLRNAGSAQVSSGTTSAGIKQVDEIQFFEGGERYRMLHAERMRLRDELSAVLGAPNMWRHRAAVGSSFVL